MKLLLLLLLFTRISLAEGESSGCVSFNPVKVSQTVVPLHWQENESFEGCEDTELDELLLVLILAILFRFDMGSCFVKRKNPFSPPRIFAVVEVDDFESDPRP
ncbi:hypothetical protein BC941DRAFT_450428 [Chlamydoabsidia padenii]|nr:hypothetical protein BC941DRAFT_450428 [Chlamydoabsidia padenii]